MPAVIDSELQAREYAKPFLDALTVTSGGAAAPGETHAAGMRTMTISAGPRKPKSYQVSLDVSEQVLRLATPVEFSFGERTGTAEAPLFPSFAAAGIKAGSFVPAAALGLKGKSFDDGLYAAVELTSNDGKGKMPGRLPFLRNLLAAVAASSHDGGKRAAASLLAGALLLTEQELNVSADVAREAEKLVAEFLKDEKRSKPIGFYTWSRELCRIFRRDRFLQRTLEVPLAHVLTTTLSNDEALASCYGSMLEFSEQLTNPLAPTDLREALAAKKAGGQPELSPPISLFPPSQAHETELIKKMYGNRPIPDGFNLADEMVRRIRAGSFDLTPRANSGWYDHQTFALEPLVVPEKMPEGARLTLTEAYRRDLLGLFKALLALTRETHVKQLGLPSCGAAAPPEGLILEVRPALSVEPLATYYLRRARSYRFVREGLERAYGAATLKQMQRVTAGGPVNLSLQEELRLMESLFHGAYLVTCQEIGLKPIEETDLGFGTSPAANARIFEIWAGSLDRDPDLGNDIRMMVPVFYDLQRKQLKVWAVLGVAGKTLNVGFEKTPRVVKVTDACGAEIPLNAVHVVFPGEGHTLAYLVTVEVYVDQLLNRTQFREHCDRYKTYSAIVGALR